MYKSFQISCDGGAATGKSTGAKMISKKYNLKFILFDCRGKNLYPIIGYKI